MPPSLRALAHRLADDARAQLQEHFRQKTAVHYKDDGSPVTQVDKLIERHLREVIARDAPHCGVIGEEEPPHKEDAEWLFVCDPLDGTLSYISGKPLFGFLLAILHDRRPLYGVMDCPLTHERWHGGQDIPCQLNDAAAHSRQDIALKDAFLHATSPHMFSPKQECAFHHLRVHTRAVLYGNDCYAYGLLASGFADVIAEAAMKPSDAMALAPIVQSAGGVISDWRGAPLTLDFDGTVLAAASLSLHRQALALLQEKEG